MMMHFSRTEVLALVEADLRARIAKGVFQYGEPLTATTELTGTCTLQGWIPHAELYTDKGLLHCPVRVVTSRRDISNLPLPERDERGNPVYALPGGGSYNPCEAKR